MKVVSRAVWLIVLSIMTANAQQVVSRFPSKAAIRDLRVHSVGDSLLVALDLGPDLPARSFWLDSTFQLVRANWVPSSDEFMMANGSSLYFYSFRSRKAESNLHIRTSKVGEGEFDIPVMGRLLSVFPNGRVLQCISFIADKKLVRVTEVVGTQLKRSVDFKVITDFTKTVGMQCVLPGTHATVSSMVGQVKVYPTTADKIVITYDIPRNGIEAPGQAGRIILYQMDLATATVETKELITPSWDNFRSVLIDSTLYRIVFTRDKWTVETLTLDGTVKAQFPILRDEAAKFQPVYNHDGQNNMVSASDDLASLIKSVDKSEPFVSVERTRDGKLILTTGTYFDPSGTMVTPLGSSVVLGILSAFAVSSMRQALNGPGLARYTYLIENGPGELMVADKSARIARRLADDFEITETHDGAKLKITRYAIFRKHLLGFYNDRAAKEMRVVDFGLVEE